MRKHDELSCLNSCMNKAAENEMTFVLLGRDVAAPAAIRAWIEERIRTEKNKSDDEQIKEAEACIRTMIHERILGRIGGSV